MVYNMKFTNYSPTEWTRSVNGSSIDAVMQNLTHTPSGHLKANSGVEQLGADQSILSFVATGYIDLYCCWYDPSTTERFGVKIHIPLQVLGMGTAPYWYVMSDKTSNINAAPNWIKAGNDPADSYTWTNVSGYKIRGTPTASHSSLSVDVIIEKA